MRALVIEDDAIIAMLIEDELRDLGFSSVDVATTEDEAVLAVTRRRPDLVTFHGSLLAGTGAGAVGQIRCSLSVPVIFITADPEAARNCLPDAQVLEKPFTRAQLSAAVEQVQLPALGVH